jgi:hypothetical protein
MKVKIVEFKKYRGVNIPGSVSMPKPDGDMSTHLGRASWLTASVESNGKFGAIMNYDGTGMTAGIHQAVAVFPRDLDARGSLWDLLKTVVLGPDEDFVSHEVADLWNSLANPMLDAGLRVHVSDFEPLSVLNGVPIKRASGRVIRTALTGNSEGRMPLTGYAHDLAICIAKSFSRLFSHPDTFDGQLAYGEKHFRSMARRKLRFSKRLHEETLDSLLYEPLLGVALGDEVERPPDLPPALDLALCMLYSHSVNAPGMALKVLCKVVDGVKPTDSTFARRLVRALGETKYGRWDDDIPNGRYQRTRTYAMEFWPSYLFEGSGIMPKDL